MGRMKKVDRVSVCHTQRANARGKTLKGVGKTFDGELTHRAYWLDLFGGARCAGRVL